MVNMVKCKATTKAGSSCKSPAIKGTDYCFFHTPQAVTAPRSTEDIDLSQAVITTKSHKRPYRGLYRRDDYEAVAPHTWQKYEKLYREDELVGMAIDYYVDKATATGFQLIDTETGERDTDNVKIIEELDNKMGLLKCLKKTIRGLLIWGNVWAEMNIDGTNIDRLIFLPPHQMSVRRDKSGNPTAHIQTAVGEKIEPQEIIWEGKGGKYPLRNILYSRRNVLYSEPHGMGLIERIYNLADKVETIQENIIDIGKFVSYPFRIVKVGTDNYPASSQAVTDVGNKVDDLEPGDWLITRHNIDFQFESPEMPDALTSNYRDQLTNLVVGLGVPMIYAAMEDANPRILQDIRDMFSSMVQDIRNIVAEDFEKQLFRRQFELKKKPHDEPLVKIVWNPLAPTIVNILDLTSLVQAGIIGIGEARRIVEAMGYTLLVGEEWEGGEPEALGGLPDVGKPTPSLQPERRQIMPAPQPGQTKPGQPPQPGQQPQAPPQMTPPMSLEARLKIIEQLAEVDRFEARQRLIRLLEGRDIFMIEGDENVKED